jgi:mersacidin/lichenicidin family type 2 lantibiotic
MSTLNIIRAWKDEEYRAGLGEAERALLPDHPAGSLDEIDAALEAAAGGTVAGLLITLTPGVCSILCFSWGGEDLPCPNAN